MGSGPLPFRAPSCFEVAVELFCELEGGGEGGDQHGLQLAIFNLERCACPGPRFCPGMAPAQAI